MSMPSISYLTLKKVGRITDFAAERNRLLESAKTDWVFFFDSDEKISPSLKAEVERRITDPAFSGYFLRRDDVFMGKKLRHGETAHVNLLRLAKKNAGVWRGRVHEVWEINGRTGQLKNRLLHRPHQSVRAFLDKINYYTDIGAHRRFSVFRTVSFPPGKFFQNYILRLGFLDSLPGLVMAFMMSLHSLISRVKEYESSAHSN